MEIFYKPFSLFISLVRAFFSGLLFHFAILFWTKERKWKIHFTFGQAFEFRRRRIANDDAGKTHTKKFAYRRNKNTEEKIAAFTLVAYNRIMYLDMGMVWWRACSVCWIYYSVCCLIACWTFAIGTMRPPLPQRIHWCNFTMELSLSVGCRPTLFQCLMSQIEIVSTFISLFRPFFLGFVLPTTENDFILLKTLQILYSDILSELLYC